MHAAGVSDGLFGEHLASYHVCYGMDRGMKGNEGYCRRARNRRSGAGQVSQ